MVFQSVQIIASPLATPSSQAEVLLPALETVSFDDQAQPIQTSALIAGGISVNEQDFQAVATVTPADWVTVSGQIWTDLAHWNQPAEIIVYGRYQADHSNPVGFMLVKDEVGDKPKIQPWNGELAQLVAFETVTNLAEKDWILIYEDFLKLAAGRLELFFGYLVANVVDERRLIQNRHGIEIVIRE